MGKRGRPKKDRVPVHRTYRRDLWQRLQEYVADFRPATTDIAVIEAALEEYLDKHEPTKKERGQQ